MIRNVIFDWSGTLVDDLPAVWQATNFVLTRAKCETMTLDRFRAEFCLPFKKFYDRFVPHVPVDELEEWFHGEFRRVRASVEALPHARAFLEFCRDRKLRCFVLSTVHRDYYEAQSKSTGFADFIEKPYASVWDKREKIREMLVEHNLAPAETLFVGDMQHDIETAQHGGVHSCAVLTGYNTLNQLRAADPDLIVEHLGELKGFLAEHDLEWRPHARKFDQTHPPIVTVGALIFDSADRVLMVQTHKWSGLWGIPGGKIKWGEPSVAALRREIKEETNLEIEAIQLVMVQDCIHSREFYRDAHFVLLNYTCRCLEPSEVRLNEEARDHRWVTLSEAELLDLNEPTKRLLREVRQLPRGLPHTAIHEKREPA